MSSEIKENPVALWGDMGPDVYKLSQIYDPRNDRYVTTQDTSVASGKTYYERLSLILTRDETVQNGRTYYSRVITDGTVEYLPVENPTGSPKENGWYQDAGGKILVFSAITDLDRLTDANPYDQGWYEENPESVDTSGKYIPAVDSLVVVDEVECLYKTENNYKTRMLLTVKSVDEAFNVTFATIVFGSETEETVRAIDYGNEKFMLFFDRRADGSTFANTVMTPDRKILLYGKNSYGYRLKRNGVVISTNIPTIQEGVRNDAFVPFAKAIGERVTITAENYAELQRSGAYFDVLLPNGLQRTMQLPSDPDTLVQTCDYVFVAGNDYYTKTGNPIRLTGLVAETIGTGILYDVGITDSIGNILKFDKFYEHNGVRYVATRDTRFVDGKEYYVNLADVIEDHENEYVLANINSFVGTRIDDYGIPVFRKIVDDLEGRVAYRYEDPTAVVGNVYVPERCYLKAGMSLVDGEAINMEIFMFDYATRTAQLCMVITVIAKEATPLDQTDITTRQIVRFDVELNGSDTVGDVWYLQQGEDWRQVFNFMPKISFDDGSDLSVPIDNKSCFVYGLENITSKVTEGFENVSRLVGREFQILFKYFPHKSMNIDWQKIGLTPTKHFLTCRKTVKIINDLAYKIRKISLIPAWDQQTNMYELYYMIFKNDYVSPAIIRSGIDSKFTVATFSLTEDTEKNATKTYYQRLNTGKFISVTVESGQNPKSLGLYEMTIQSKTSLEDVMYLNEDQSVQYIPSSAAGDTMGVIQHAILGERVFVDGVNATNVYTQPVVFKLQRMSLKNEPIKWLIGDDHNGREDVLLPYGSTMVYNVREDAAVPDRAINRPYVLHEAITTNEGTEHTFRIPSGGDSGFTTNDGNGHNTFLEAFWYNAQPPNGAFDENTPEAEAFQPTHFFYRAPSDDSVASEFIPIDEFDNAVKIEGGGEADTTVGGIIPVTNMVDPYYGGTGRMNLMGTIIVEFVHQYVNPDDPTKYLYKHLYAVPVEVRDKNW